MAKTYGYLYDDKYKPTECIGSFGSDTDDGFKQNLRATAESFNNSSLKAFGSDIAQIVTTEAFWQQYKEELFGDVLGANYESAFDTAGDGAAMESFSMANGAKLEQMVENSRQEMVTEASNVGMLSPIVAATLPILKKEYILNQFKDMIHTVVAPQPIIRYTYERRFLKDKAGAKKYFPECFYDDTYAEFTDQTVGKPISSKWYKTNAGGAITNLNMLEESGGSLASRDALGLDFCIDGVKVTVPSTAVPSGEEVTLEGLKLKPDYDKQTFSSTTIEIPSKVEGVNTSTHVFVMGVFDPYTGIVNMAITTDNTQVDTSKIHVKFGGHLSNANNDATIELDKERHNEEITIAEKERFNSGLTLEKLKEEKALSNIDVTVEVVSDMSDVAAQTADSNIKRFLEDSYVKTMDIEATRIFQPMGYNFKFADAYEMSLAAPTPYMAPESNWRSQQIRFYFERVLSYLKTKLRDERIMFTVSANPYVVEQLCATDGGVKWVLNDNANIGGVKLDYHFGVMTVNGTRVHIISTMKESIEKGFRICIIPLTDTIITYRQYQFSFNVETNYRNPYTPNIPNIMCCQRYENIEVLPIQSNFNFKEFKEGNLCMSPDATYAGFIQQHGGV